MVESGATSISSKAVAKLVSRALLENGVSPSRIEVQGKSISVVAPSEELTAARSVLDFGFLLDAGLIDYHLQVDAVPDNP